MITASRHVVRLREPPRPGSGEVPVPQTGTVAVFRLSPRVSVLEPPRPGSGVVPVLTTDRNCGIIPLLATLCVCVSPQIGIWVDDYRFSPRVSMREPPRPGSGVVPELTTDWDCGSSSAAHHV